MRELTGRNTVAVSVPNYTPVVTDVAKINVAPPIYFKDYVLD